MNTKTLTTTLMSSLIILSIIILAACSPTSSAPIVMAQADTAEKPLLTGPVGSQSYGEDDVVRSWEIDADDIAAAREAAQYLAEVVKIAIQQEAGGG